jgi:NitT/TauT family transport system permease protein
MSIAEDRPVPPSGAQPVDAEEARRARNRRIETIAKWVLPVAIMILTIFLWGWVVRANEIPHFILPGPDRVWDSLVNDWGILIDAAYLTGGSRSLRSSSPWWGARGSRSCSTSRRCWSCRSTPTR